MRNVVQILALAGVSALCFLQGCSNIDSKLSEAVAAENTGNYRDGATLYADLALKLSPIYKLPEPQKGKTIQPSIWQADVEKYIKWLTEPQPQKNNILRQSLDGLDRCAEQLEQDNVLRQTSAKPLETTGAFTAQWNQAFNPPLSGAIDWVALTKQAEDNKFSVYKLTAPKSYSYDLNFVSRKTARRVYVKLLAENTLYVPLAPGEYSLIVKSSVEFQNRQQRWSSEYSAFSISVTDTASLVEMNFRTQAARKQP
jgi:hypothetical protein